MNKKILLDESDIPDRWYNILPDMPAPPEPYLNPQTLQPMGPLRNFRRLERGEIFPRWMTRRPMRSFARTR